MTLLKGNDDNLVLRITVESISGPDINSDVDWERLGQAISRCVNLKMLYLKIEREEHIPLDSPANVPLNVTQTAARNLDMFFRSLSRNTYVS